jgi:hypothetical protein
MVWWIEPTVSTWTARNVMREETVEEPVESPKPAARWSSLEHVIYNALLPFAEARAAVSRALGELQPVNSS